LCGGKVISWEVVKDLLPETTLSFLKTSDGQAIVERIINSTAGH
jgi:citrate lyase synthetase